MEVTDPMTENSFQDKYLFFSSQELIDYFMNNLKEKDIKTQCKRIFEMARVLLNKKKFKFNQIYSLLIMVRDIRQCSIIKEVLKLYFDEGEYPIGVLIEIADLEGTADLEIEFSAFKGERLVLNTLESNDTSYFSQGVVIENYLHSSGISYFDGNRDETDAKNFKQEVKKCLNNLETILNSAGTAMDKVYTFIVYLKDINNLPLLEEVFSEMDLSRNEVQREVVKVNNLYGNHELEISCSARLR